MYAGCEIRQLVRHTEAVKSAMSSGNFDLLKDAVVALTDITAKLLPANKDDEIWNINNERQRFHVDEETLMSEFGEGLREVEIARDTYVTTSCDVCDQLKKDVQPLKFYEGKKGYDSEKNDRNC